MSKGGRLRSNFNLGGEQAEADPLLELAFYQSPDFEVIEARRDPRCFIVGRTGSGKSAALQRLELIHPGKVIRITPEDLSLPYIVDLHVLRYLDSLDVHLDLLFIALWKHVLLVELIRHRYKVDSPVAKQNFLANLREKIKRDPGKKAALDYLDEFQGKFWCEADERVREITEKFQERVDAASRTNISFGKSSVGLNAGTEATLSSESKAEQAERFQRIVNETQLARLNKMLSVLDEDILDSAQNYTYVVIDDLDRDWVDERLANDLIRCLFRTVLDLKRVRHLKVLVALRTNIFQELDFGERTGGQEEKFRSLVLQMRWSKYDLEEMLDERTRVAARQLNLSINGIRDILPQTNRTRGDAFEYILDHTLMRPRDSISFVNECLALAVQNNRLSWKDIHTAEQGYSGKRLLALRDEWRPTYPDIHRVLNEFQRSTVPMSREDFTAHLDEVMLLVADPDFQGTRWLTKLSEPMWSGFSDQGWVDLYQPLIKMLYTIGFVGFSSSKQKVPVFSYDDAQLADRPSSLDKISGFHIHQAYHSALDITVRGGGSRSRR